MDHFIFKPWKEGLLHILGNGKHVYYDYSQIVKMKNIIDKYLNETPRPEWYKGPEPTPDIMLNDLGKFIDNHSALIDTETHGKAILIHDLIDWMVSKGWQP